MWKEWKKRVIKNDGKIFKRLSRCLFDTRASVFLEFAFAMPLIMVMSLFILEMVLFWDTTVMANHSAFAVARVAKVHTDSTGSTDYPDLNIGGEILPADEAITAMFMMASTFSWMDGNKPSAQADFESYFDINDNLITVEVNPDSNILIKLVGDILSKLVGKVDTLLKDGLNDIINDDLKKLFTGSVKGELNQRYNMALQRVKKTGCVTTKYHPLEGTLAFPSDDVSGGSDINPTGDYSEPGIVKVSIKYPLHSAFRSKADAGWLYQLFDYWGNKSTTSTPKAPTAIGTFSMLSEPQKLNLKGYLADDEGGSSNPDWKKEAEKRAKKIIKETATLVDKWIVAVKARVSIQKQSGTKSDAYKAALTKETNLWAKITSKINEYRNTINPICKGKNDRVCGAHIGKWCLWHDYPCHKTHCWRSENAKSKYCSAVAKKIIDTAGKYDIFAGSNTKNVPHYVHYGDINRSFGYSSHCGRECSGM